MANKENKVEMATPHASLVAEALVREYLVSVRASAASCRRAVRALGACYAAVLCRADDSRQRCTTRHDTG